MLYLPEVELADGGLRELTIIPFEIRRFRLGHANAATRGWLQRELRREYARFGLSVEPGPDGSFRLTG
jgi:hypothetical protein